MVGYIAGHQDIGAGSLGVLDKITAGSPHNSDSRNSPLLIAYDSNGNAPQSFQPAGIFAQTDGTDAANAAKTRSAAIRRYKDLIVVQPCFPGQPVVNAILCLI